MSSTPVHTGNDNISVFPSLEDREREMRIVINNGHDGKILSPYKDVTSIACFRCVACRILMTSNDIKSITRNTMSPMCRVCYKNAMRLERFRGILSKKSNDTRKHDDRNRHHRPRHEKETRDVPIITDPLKKNKKKHKKRYNRHGPTLKDKIGILVETSSAMKNDVNALVKNNMVLTNAVNALYMLLSTRGSAPVYNSDPLKNLKQHIVPMGDSYEDKKSTLVPAGRDSRDDDSSSNSHSDSGSNSKISHFNNSSLDSGSISSSNSSSIADDDGTDGPAKQPSEAVRVPATFKNIEAKQSKKGKK
jgi:hypothetical protein